MPTIEFHSPDGLPEDIVRFWHTRQNAQDKILAFTSGSEWFAMMADKRDPAAVVLAVKDDKGSLKAVLPLLFMDLEVGILPVKTGRKKIRVAKVCGGDLIEKDASPQELVEAWDQLGDQYPKIEAVWFDHVASKERSRRVAESCSSGRWFMHRLYSDMPHYRFVLPRTLEQFSGLRSVNTLKKMEGRERALGRQVNGDCRIVEMKRESDWCPYAKEIECLMNSAWQATLLGHRFRIGDLEQVAAKGWLRAFLLLAGDVVAAFAVCYQGKETLVYETIGYDQDYAKHSPGTLLLYRIIEHVYRENTPKYFDFGEGEAKYKSQLANDVIRVDACLVARRKPRLIGLLGLHRLSAQAAAAGRAVLNIVGLRQRLVSRAKRKTRIRSLTE
jgi:hypothetical protein